MTDWLYKGEPYQEPGEYYGFVYLITNLLSGRQYIGKKFFWTLKRKQVNKKRKSYKVESDWKEYWSSSDELKADVEALGKENFKREMLYVCVYKKDPKAGDVFTLYSAQQRRIHHTGFFDKKINESIIQTVEGNTSGDNPQNGGEVAVMERSMAVVHCFGRVKE